MNRGKSKSFYCAMAELSEVDLVNVYIHIDPENFGNEARPGRGSLFLLP